MHFAVIGSKLLSELKSSEDGAVTVDFVVLTAAIMLIGVVGVASFSGGAVQVATDTANIVASQLE